MRLELKDIKDGGLIKELTCTSSDFPVLVEMEPQDEVRFTQPIEFHLRLQKSGQLVEVEGSLWTGMELVCGRCLQRYARGLSADFAFTYTPLVTDKQDVPEEDSEIELGADELGLVFYRDECLDLFQPLQDQLVMALPIRPICMGDCKGLCSKCGCNLNTHTCDCVRKPFNNKFTALAELDINVSED